MELEAVLRNGPYSQPFDCESDEKLMEIAGSFLDQLASIGADSPLREGCRMLYHRTQSMPPRQQHQRIDISTVQIDTWSFISGINLFRQVQSDIAFQFPRSEKRYRAPRTRKYLAWRFARKG